MVTQHSESLWAHRGRAALEEHADGVRCLGTKNRFGYAEQISWEHQGAIIDATEQTNIGDEATEAFTLQRKKVPNQTFSLTDLMLKYDLYNIEKCHKIGF